MSLYPPLCPGWGLIAWFAENEDKGAYRRATAWPWLSVGITKLSEGSSRFSGLDIPYEEGEVDKAWTTSRARTTTKRSLCIPLRCDTTCQQTIGEVKMEKLKTAQYGVRDPGLTLTTVQGRTCSLSLSQWSKGGDGTVRRR